MSDSLLTGHTMTIEQRLEQVEQQNQKIQRTNKRLPVALTMRVAVAPDKIGEYACAATAISVTYVTKRRNRIPRKRHTLLTLTGGV